MKKVGIWGWWQGNNLGDNWIKKTLSKFFPEAVFLSTEVKTFAEFDFIICGGGGLFIYDVINPFRKVDIGVPYGVLGMGAEFEHRSEIASEIKQSAKFFYVRDEYSIDCMHLPSSCKSYDVTFLNPLPVMAGNKSTDTVFFVWRDGKDLISDSRFSNYINYADVAEEWDKCLNQEFSRVVKDDFQTSKDDILERTEGCDFIVSGRYHGIVAAIQIGVPFIAIDICPKIRALVKECGLEEYCIKISEIDKIHDLIVKAKTCRAEIREKERKFTALANSCLLIQMNDIIRIIAKELYPFKILHYGSYWMGENDVINTMSDDLVDSFFAKKIDLKAYTSKVDSRIATIEKTPNGTVMQLNEKYVLADIASYKPDAIVLNSGGLCMPKSLVNALKKNNITTIGISLSDPDVYPYNGKRYSKDFDIFYTNSKWSYENQYDSAVQNVHLLPFAASLKHHYYMPEVEKKFDLVVVGHAREDRQRIVDKLKTVCSVGLYGGGWKNGLGVVNGIDHVRALNSGKMYLSFSKTVAGFDNVKVGLFEAVACRQFVLTSYMEELNDYFDIGKEIVCYKNEAELVELVKYYAEHDSERERIMNAGYIRFLTEHTYQRRWLAVMRDIEKEKMRTCQ